MPVVDIPKAHREWVPTDTFVEQGVVCPFTVPVTATEFPLVLDALAEWPTAREGTH